MQAYDSKTLSLWWRFTEYEIVEVTGSRLYIRPAPGARLEPYHWSPSGQDEGSSNPEMHIGKHFETLLNLNLGSDTEIIEWCRTYGLLGILAQQMLQLTLAPRWGAVFDDHYPKVLAPHQVRYIRTNKGWRTAIERSGRGPVIGEMDPSDVDRVIDRFYDHLNQVVDPMETALPRPSALIHEFPSLVGRTVEPLQIRSVVDSVAPFFPDVPEYQKENYEYPLPLSWRFWREYGEPLDEFLGAVADFKQMVEHLGHQAETDVRGAGLAMRGEDQLNSLLTINPVLSIRPGGTPVGRWNMTSLLALFAFEVKERLTAEETFRRCRRSRCRRIFATKLRSKEYCTEKCRVNEERSRERQKKKLARGES